MTLEVVLGSISSDTFRGPSSGSKDPAARTGKAVRVLVVDDEPSICEAVSAALVRWGYEVVMAQSGEAALAIVRGEAIDVMLIDLRIPDMRGDIVFEVAAATQPHLAYQTLFMTGDITENAHALIVATKCHFLRKPFDLNCMFHAIAAIAPTVHELVRDQTA
jgi:two-component system, OmpR family, response regulator